MWADVKARFYMEILSANPRLRGVLADLRALIKHVLRPSNELDQAKFIS